MGDLIDATGYFRMRRLEADVARAEHTPLWGTSIIEATNLASKQRELNKIIRAGLYDATGIILPPTLEED